MQQVEQGHLDLNSPLHDFVPEFNLKSRFGSIDAITLRNTLSNHAGIPANFVAGMWSNKPKSFKLVASQLNDYYAAYPPNTVFAYSNAGFSLAGHAVENASGIPNAHYMQQLILQPLGMTASNFAFDTSNVRVADSYWDGKQVDELGLRDLPAGGLVTNVTNLSQLLIEIHSTHEGVPRVLQHASLVQMMRPQEYDSPHEITHYNGLGFLQYPDILNGMSPAVGHDGQTMAHSASLISIPELQLGVVLLANSPDQAGTLAEISDELHSLAYTVKSGRAPDSSMPSNKEPLPGSPTSFKGTYASEFGVIEIQNSAPPHRVHAMGQRLVLSPNASGDYKVKLNLFGFIPIAPGELKELTFHTRKIDSGKLIVADVNANRLVVATEANNQPSNDIWDSRMGTYELTNGIDTDIAYLQVPTVTLGYSSSFYFMQAAGESAAFSYPLKIETDSSATVQGWGRGLGETLLINEDGTLVHQVLIFRKTD